MPSKRKKSSFGPIFLILLVIVLGAGYYIHSQGGLPYVKEHVEKAREVIAPLFSPEPTSTAPQGQAKSYTVGSYAQTFTYAGKPVPTSYPNSITVLENTAYVVGYDETRENPAWVAYRIPARTVPGDFPRPKHFQTDSRTRAQVTHDDYTGTGYDRGHMAPNLAIASHFGEQAQKETFLMSNVVPQRGDLNQGPWRLLEETLSSVTAPADGVIWVVTGPIYDNQPQHLRAGNEIPDAFFMAIADETPNGPRLQAFILPQSAPRRADFRAYRTSVDEIEKETGLNFFTELPDTQEEQLESDTAPYWLESPQ
jgi:endonuclease G, mitochondrial